MLPTFSYWWNLLVLQLAGLRKWPSTRLNSAKSESKLKTKWGQGYLRIGFEIAYTEKIELMRSWKRYFLLFQNFSKLPSRGISYIPYIIYRISYTVYYISQLRFTIFSNKFIYAQKHHKKLRLWFPYVSFYSVGL